jgi:G:T-mismatch repair DNA endonuclease (very short patch repair protein)
MFRACGLRWVKRISKYVPKEGRLVQTEELSKLRHLGWRTLLMVKCSIHKIRHEKEACT